MRTSLTIILLVFQKIKDEQIGKEVLNNQTCDIDVHMYLLASKKISFFQDCPLFYIEEGI